MNIRLSNACTCFCALKMQTKWHFIGEKIVDKYTHTHTPHTHQSTNFVATVRFDCRWNLSSDRESENEWTPYQNGKWQDKKKIWQCAARFVLLMCIDCNVKTMNESIFLCFILVFLLKSVFIRWMCGSYVSTHSLNDFIWTKNSCAVAESVAMAK